MFLILISCNNSILPERFYFTDKRLYVSPPASRSRPPQSSRSIPTQGTNVISRTFGEQMYDLHLATAHHQAIDRAFQVLLTCSISNLSKAGGRVNKKRGHF